jgi:hypothetical protein
LPYWLADEKLRVLQAVFLIRIGSGFGIWIRIKEGKNYLPTKIGKSSEISYFEVLDVLF